MNTAATPVVNNRNGGKRPSINDGERFNSSTATVPLPWTMHNNFPIFVLLLSFILIQSNLYNKILQVVQLDWREQRLLYWTHSPRKWLSHFLWSFLPWLDAIYSSFFCYFREKYHEKKEEKISTRKCPLTDLKGYTSPPSIHADIFRISILREIFH